jgi:hypothetical protein
MSMIAPPTLAPLRASAQYDETEDQIKKLTLEIFAEYFRAYERDLNAYGAPHLGSFELVERWVKADGLAMVRSDSENAMRYLFKAWRARNPKRGLHFLQTYLQLLWPGRATVDRLWQDKLINYPHGLVRESDIPSDDPSESHYLTSRVLVEVDADDEQGRGLSTVRRALRSALAAKFVLLCRLLKMVQVEIGIGAYTQGSKHPRVASDVELVGEVSERSHIVAASVFRSSARVIVSKSTF